jgi:uncharacterized protein
VIVVVSDTSPLRALNFLGKIELLEQLFGFLFLPPAVAEELKHPRPRFQPLDPGLYPFLHVSPPKNLARVREFQDLIDAGEAEAIVLAIEKNADFVLMDELAGRSIVQDLKMTPVGTVGILLRAKELKLIDSIAPLINKLQTELGFYIAESLRAEFLRQAGE